MVERASCAPLAPPVAPTLHSVLEQMLAHGGATPARIAFTFVREDGSRSELVHSVRTYTPHELAVMLVQAGLQVAGAWGDFEGAELTLDSWRLILLGQKQGAAE